MELKLRTLCVLCWSVVGISAHILALLHCLDSALSIFYRTDIFEMEFIILSPTQDSLLSEILSFIVQLWLSPDESEYLAPKSTCFWIFAVPMHIVHSCTCTLKESSATREIYSFKYLH